MLIEGIFKMSNGISIRQIALLRLLFETWKAYFPNSLVMFHITPFPKKLISQEIGLIYNRNLSIEVICKEY